MSAIEPPSGLGADALDPARRLKAPPWHPRAMTRDDLPEVSLIESDIFQAPWSYGNFSDSLQAGYDCWVFQTHLGSGSGGSLSSAVDRRSILGYSVLMWTPDDLHLLNLSVRRPVQGQGLGRAWLAWLLDDARSRGASTMLLEVRPSNIAGLRLYEWAGFQRIGLRRAYYPPHQGHREDAIVMRRRIETA